MSFKQLDALNGSRKGTSFRAFKRRRDQLREGTDYFYLSNERHADFIESLRRAGVVYASTHHLVLVTERGYAKIRHESP